MPTTVRVLGCTTLLHHDAPDLSIVGNNRLQSLPSLRLGATDPPLEKVRLARASAMLTTPYQPVVLARVEDFDVLLMAAQGFGPQEAAPGHSALWFAVRGSVGVETTEGAGARLEAGELTVVPAGVRYRLHAAQSSLLLTLARTSQGSTQ